MTYQQAVATYPALMAYIESRNLIETSDEWCGQLRLDECAAIQGEFAEVAAELAQAKADFGSYPYNRAMGEFLGLAVKSNGDPKHGYYMACRVENHHALGVASRRAVELVAEGRELRIVTAKSKATGKGVRFARFKGVEQIVLSSQDVSLNNGKVCVRLSSNWSIETCLEAVVRALESGLAYGEAAA